MRDYEYELRHGTVVIATGRIQLDEQPARGDTLSLGTRRVQVEDVLALRGSRRLILSQT